MRIIIYEGRTKPVSYTHLDVYKRQELDEASGEYKVAGQKTMEDFAEGLNLSMPMVQAMFGEMEEFGGEFDWADEATKTLGCLLYTSRCV